ncbi:hypothetical protein VNO78_02030 [Psophocarpus tetragonolobus]|uniref:Secreted protein n=1 Tax=Psophocarpus tetragonolobus TaxID=3891 RepID=A0AAN9T028_PSOTE
MISSFWKLIVLRNVTHFLGLCLASRGCRVWWNRGGASGKDHLLGALVSRRALSKYVVASFTRIPEDEPFAEPLVLRINFNSSFTLIHLVSSPWDNATIALS